MKVKTNRFFMRALFAVILLGVAAYFLFYHSPRSSNEITLFQTASVKKGNLMASISATGTVEPEELVDVGSQVAGMIVSFGKDQSGKIIDYGSAVEEGMILAKIDDSLYAAEVAQAKAQLEQARAGVERAEADLGQLQARFVQAERDWNRARKLGPSEALAQSAYDTALSGYEVAKANLSVGKAAIAQAKSAVAQSQAVLSKAQQNLDYCTIKSPVRGIIIDRRVNIGQTVVASLNAPSLFLIAKDLTRLQVWVSVNEADIGNIRPGQPVNFTVDAFPGEVFQGTVGKVRLNATMTQNVVTYTVEVSTDNSNGKLLPYLTANAKFILNERKDVLMVPNVALRWAPRAELVSGDGLNKGSAQLVRSGPPADSVKEERGRSVVWVAQGDLVRSIPVRIGLTDGAFTEIESTELTEGTQIVTGEQAKQATDSTPSASPFAPKFGGGPRR